MYKILFKEEAIPSWYELLILMLFFFLLGIFTLCVISIQGSFGTGKHFCYYHINTICANLGVERSWALPPFHAFTGCDTTSSFFGRSKKSAWQAWSAYPEATEAFVHIAQHPYEPISLFSEHFLTLERFTVLWYCTTNPVVLLQ